MTLWTGWLYGQWGWLVTFRQACEGEAGLNVPTPRTEPQPSHG